MRKNIKAKVSTLLAGLSLLVMGLGFSLWQSDKPIVEVQASHASTISGFTIDETAAIRRQDPLGIRFTVNLGTEAQVVYGDLDNVTCGTLMIPEDMLTGELTFDTDAVLDVPTSIWKEHLAVYQSVLGGYADDNGKILDIPESYYNRPIVARGYIKGEKTVNGNVQTYTYYTENTSTRSIGYIAKMAQLAGETTTTLLDTIASKATVEFAENITLSIVGDSAMLHNTVADNYAYGLTIGGIPADIFDAKYQTNVTDISYVTNDSETVSVEEGKLVAKKVGSTTVSASVKLNGQEYTGTINVTVNDVVEFASKYMILVPAGTMSAHYAAPVKYAANELKKLFEEATGASIDIREETGNETTNGKYIALGDTELGSSVTLSETKETASVVKTVGNTIVVKGVTDEGTMYGTYEWLASLLGYEYYAKDTYSLTKDAVTLINSTTANWDTSYIPDIEYSISPSEDISINDNLLNRYRMNNWYSDIMVVNGGRIHNTFNILPPFDNMESSETAGNYKDHPKWYTSNDKGIWGYGTLEYTDGYGRNCPYELCFNARGDGNEYSTMVSTAVQAYTDALTADKTMTKASLSIRDNVIWCKCEVCKEENGTDSAIGFLNDVCAGIRTWLTENNDPRKDTFRMIFLAYYTTGAAPTTETTLDPYIDVWFAESFAVYTLPMNDASAAGETATAWTNLQAWANLLNQSQNCTNGVRNNNLLVWTYNSNMYTLLAPYDSFNSMRVNYGLFKGLNVDSVYNYTDAAMSGWAALKKYLASQLAWNATPDDTAWNAWIDNFFTNAYGAGATQMQAWFENYLTYEDTITHKFNIAHNVESNPIKGSIYQDVATSEFFTKDILNTWLGYADAALNALDKNDPNYQTYYNNIAIERLSPIYLMLEIYGDELDKQTKIGYVATFCSEAASLGIQKTGHTVSIDETLTSYNELLTVEKDVAVGVGETLASNSIFDNSEEIASVKINGVEAYNNGQISLTSTGAYKAIVTGTSGTMKVVMFHYADKVIRTVEDLSAVKYTVVGGQNETGSISGYYVLGNDIDAAGATISGAGYGWSQNTGFRGVFDGRNYTISNLTINGNGIFGTLGGATVQNVNFEGVTLGQNSALFASMSYKSTVQNVNVTYAGINAEVTSYAGLLFARQSNNQNYWKNVILDANKLTVPVALGYNTNNNTYENVTIKAVAVRVIGYTDGGNTAITEWPTGITFEEVELAQEVTVSDEILAEIGGTVNGSALTVEKTKFTHSSLTAGEEVSMTVNGAAVSATAYDGYVLADLNGVGVTAGTVTTATIMTADYTIIYDNVFAVTMIINTFDELSVVKYTGTRITGYYVLGGNISGNWATISGASSGWGTGVGFGGTFDGRGYTIDRFNVSGYGMFGTLGTGTVKNVNFDMVTLNGGAALFARTMSGGTIENVTLKLNDYKSTSGECGIFVSRQTNSKSVYRNVTVDANSLDIYNVLGREYDANTTTVDNFVINNAGAVTLYGTSDSSGATAIEKPTGLTINNTTVKVEEIITTALAADNSTGLIVNNANIKSGDTITVTVNEATATATATADGTVTVDVSSLSLTAGTVYSVVLDSTNYTLTCEDVTFADKAIRTKADLNSVRYNGTNITGYFVLANDILDYGAVSTLTPSMNWSADQGFMGTFDGNGYKVSGMNFTSVRNGFFVQIGQGAYLKDFTFDEVIAESGYQRSILAYFCFGGTSGGTVIENVTIRFKQLKATATSQQEASSMLIGRSMNNTNLINVTLDASGLDIPAWLYVLSQEVQNSCKFTNCTVKANSFVEITRGNSTNWYSVTFEDTDA